MKKIYTIIIMFVAHADISNECGDLNPFMPNIFSHPYQLDESISSLGLLGGSFHFIHFFNSNLQ